MKIETPGIYDLPADEYHSDPAPEPSLSSSIAKKLVGKTPRHAWLEHPRLNPGYVAEDNKKYDMGTASHAVRLEGKDVVVIIDADSFRTKDAQAARDAAYAVGKIPLLPDQAAAVLAMHKASVAQLKSHEEGFKAFMEGLPEQTLVWQEDGIWCRARLDWLDAPGRYIWDYKTTTSAHPDDWQRRLFDLGYDLQAAWYLRGVKALGLIDQPEFRFIVQEVSAPYALSVIGLTPTAMALGEMKVWRAMETWRWCLKNDRWPGYPNQTCYIEPPAWELGKIEEMKARDEMAREDGKVLVETYTDWQAPLTTEAAE